MTVNTSPGKIPSLWGLYIDEEVIIAVNAIVAFLIWTIIAYGLIPALDFIIENFI